jgi:hypothetical protein
MLLGLQRFPKTCKVLHIIFVKNALRRCHESVTFHWESFGNAIVASITIF